MICFGLDVSKGYANIGIINKQGIQLKETFLIDDTKEGHEAFKESIKWAVKLNEDGVIKIGMESSGGYELNFLNLCFNMQDEYTLLVYRLNPLSVKKFIETDLHRAKNDDTNAIDIARYILKKDIMPTQKIGKEIQGLKDVVKAIERDVKESTKLRNIVQMYIQEYFPELLKYCGYGINDWVLKLLSKYPTAFDIKLINTKDLMEIPYLKELKAKDIIELANKSIAAEAGFLTKISIKQTCKRILQIDESASEMKREMININKKLSFNRLSTIYGIGDYTAGVITAFTGNIDNFSDFKKYTAFFGLDPRANDSGDEIKKRRITKKGNHIVRKVLYTSVLTCISKEGHPVKKMYDRLINRGVPHYSAATACMKKLLSIVFGILKSGKDFDINYEDSKKAEEQSAKSLGQKNLRLKRCESLNLDAPISIKERKRRIKIAAMS